MDIKQLTAFVKVSDLGSVTRAAGFLQSSQSAVTRQIQSLEHELGITLFERTRGGMELTAAGRVMAEHSRTALIELGRARAQIAPISGAFGGQVTVGLLESLAEVVGIPLAAAVRRDHPEIELRLAVGDSGRLRRWYADGELDVVLTAEGPEPVPGAATPLAIEPLWVIAPVDVRLRSDVPVALREVAGHPLVLPPPGSALRDLLDTMALGPGAGLRTAVCTGSLRMQNRLVREGRGWAILPPVAFAEDLAAQRISAAPIHSPRLRRRIVAVTAESGRSSPAGEVVARLLVGRARTEIRDGRWPSAQLAAVD